MRRVLRWPVVFIAVAVAGVLGQAGIAGAKVLPIQSIAVAPAPRTVGQPISVELRFVPPTDLGDFAWEKMEVFVVPAPRTDASGWPRRATDGGQPIALRRFAPGAYRGTFVARQPGDYVVVDRSAFISHREPNVAFPKTSVTPVRIHIVAPPAPPKSHQSGLPWPTFAIVLMAGVLAVAGAISWSARRRQRAGRESREPEEVMHGGVVSTRDGVH